jgi:hypothetical protein
MANWTPDSMVGDMFRTVGRRVPPPQGVRPAVAWGDEERVTELLGPHCSTLQFSRQVCPFRFPSTDACVEYFRTWYGPTVAAFQAVGEDGRAQLESELAAMFAAHDCASDATLGMDVEYLEIFAVRR